MNKLELLKGTRDFLPEDKIIRQNIVDILRENFERFGYNPVETPAIELFDVATRKGSSDLNTDTFNEMYILKDQAKRKLALRYEFTFQLARIISMYKELAIPFKRYQIGKIWRDGPIKKGRYREFVQCDVDIVGVKSLEADAEILAMYSKIFDSLGLEVIIKLNNRKFLEGVLEFAGINKSKREAAIISIDKLEKIGKSEVIKEAKKKGIVEDSMIKALDLLEQEGSNSQIVKNLDKFVNNKSAKEGLNEIKELLKLSKSLGAKNVKFVPSLARGLSYYTGSVFEVFLKSGKLKASLAGGGRWDNMIGNFSGNKQEVPAVGTSFGLDTIYDALILENKTFKIKSLVKVFVIPIGNVRQETIQIVSELRDKQINVDYDLMRRGISKNLKYVSNQGIPFVLFVGDKELKKNKVKLRNMKTGKEQLITLNQVIKKIS